MVTAELPPRQIPIAGNSLPDPRVCWQDSAAHFLAHVEGKTPGDGRMIRDELLHPLMQQHLGDVNGKQIFDAACGDGILSREIERQGGIVVGGDFVFAFLAAAQNENPAAQVAVLDVTKTFPFPNETFDGVVSNLAYMWLPDIVAVTEESYRILKPGGKLVVSITHPMVNLGEFNLSQPDAPRLILQASLQEGTWLKMINRTNGPYPYFQRPPATYVNTFTEAGFRLAPGTGYDDVFFPDTFLEKYPEYVRHRWYPLFLIFELIK